MGRWSKRAFDIAGIYVPHRQQAEFWSEVFELLLRISGSELILFGDFNATVNNTMDRSRNSKSSELLKVFMDNMEIFQLVDVWRRRNSIK